MEQLIALLLAAFPIKMRAARGTVCAECAVWSGERDQVGEKWECWQAGVAGRRARSEETSGASPEERHGAWKQSCARSRWPWATHSQAVLQLRSSSLPHH